MSPPVYGVMKSSEVGEEESDEELEVGKGDASKSNRGQPVVVRNGAGIVTDRNKPTGSCDQVRDLRGTHKDGRGDQNCRHQQKPQLGYSLRRAGKECCGTTRRMD